MALSIYNINVYTPNSADGIKSRKYHNIAENRVNLFVDFANKTFPDWVAIYVYEKKDKEQKTPVRVIKKGNHY